MVGRDTEHNLEHANVIRTHFKACTIFTLFGHLMSLQVFIN